MIETGCDVSIAATTAGDSRSPDVRRDAHRQRDLLLTGVLSLEGAVLDADRECLELCGYTENQILGKRFWECPLWTPSPSLVQQIKLATTNAARGELFREELPYYVADGSRRTLDLVLQPIKDQSGQPLLLALTGTDITERKQVEERQRKSEERVRLLWEAAAVLLTTDDPDLMLRHLFNKIAPHLKLDTYFNFIVNESKSALRLASCIGVSQQIANSIQHLEFGEAICGTVAAQRVPIHATEIQSSADPKVQLVKSFGIRSYACNPLIVGDELLGTLSFASRNRDRFEEDELEFLRTICQYATAAYERLRLIRELQESDRRKDEFLATLAHELRNPLAPLRNGLEMMHLARDNPNVLDEAWNMMNRQLGQMVRLIDDLMDLSRINRGKLELRKQRIDLSRVIQQAIETSRPMIQAAEHQLILSIPPSPVEVEADFTRLSQVFGNLLNNAAKYTDRGGRISVSMERDNNKAIVKIRDNGIGIPSDMLIRIFETFTQVDHSLEKAQGGLGIGLSLVKWLVELHGGTVEARSEGQGSEFIVRLPALTASISTNITRQTDDRTGTSARRILVVDDNRDAAVSLAMMLKLMGHETSTAHDGLEAIDVAEKSPPDLILLDIGMPKLNGYDTARRIRAKSWGREIKLIALTGWGQDEAKRKSFEAGFNAHMVKPVDPAVLNKVLRDEPIGEPAHSRSP